MLFIAFARSLRQAFLVCWYKISNQHIYLNRIVKRKLSVKERLTVYRKKMLPKASEFIKNSDKKRRWKIHCQRPVKTSRTGKI
jgi:hypothetical protein